MQGFVGWARARFFGPALEAALMLQRGIFVARGRRILSDLAPLPLRAVVEREGVYHSYSDRNLDAAVSSVGHVRDVSRRLVRGPVPAHIIQRFKGDLR
jgi:hypothetical protein